jgi:peptidoglycan hydrolase-like protein with peptidoglycan-binding domain
VIVALVVIAAGFLLVRAIVGSGGTAATTAPTAPATTAAAVTTPATATVGQTSPPPTLPAATTTQPLIKVPVGAVLRLGSAGTAITLLQQALTRLGYAPGLPDGSFGKATQIAVITFQQGHGLPQDGIAGTTTITAINLAQAP